MIRNIDHNREAVARSIEGNTPVAENVAEVLERRMTFGQRAADAVARFGGSWRFLGIFAAVLAGWTVLNSAALMARPFDPYPFILLNLVLSCLAAIQAPIIMMSQGRRAELDRVASENDYRVNLKAELEILEVRETLLRLERDHNALLGAIRDEVSSLRRPDLGGTDR